MKFKLSFLSVVILISSLFSACNSDDDNDTIEIDPNKELYGKWELTELHQTEAQDLNDDGIFSTNVVDELPCYFTELTFTPQFTYTYESMGIKMNYLSQNELDITCTNETSGSGTWERISPTVVKIGSENFALQGNKLISEREVEFPEFSKVVYVKVN